MPLMTFCKHPGCRRPVPRGVDFCGQHKSDAEKHAAAARKAREARRTAFKGSSAKRGYGYRWQKLRNRFIAQHPFCEQCMKQGRLTIATDIDHIKPHRGDPILLFDEENLQALCHACHSRKTASEDGGFGNERKE